MEPNVNKNEQASHRDIAQPVVDSHGPSPAKDATVVLQPVTDLGQLNRFDLAIDRWIERRLETIYDSTEKGKVVHQQLAAVDDQFISQMADVLPASMSNGALSSLLNYANSRASQRQLELLAERAERGTQSRLLIHDSINAMWHAVGSERTREVPSAASFQRVQATFAEQLPLHTAQLLSHMYEVAPAPAEIHLAEVTRRVEKTLTSIGEAAQDIAESSYLEADRNAAKLHAALPGQALRPSEMFELLSTLKPEQLKITLLAFKERYEVDFLDAARAAFDSPLVQVKNFFKIPALRAALEEKFGFGVGLMNVARVILPDMKGFRSYLTAQYWQDYAEKVSEFAKDLGNKASTPELERLEAVINGDRIAVATQSLFIAVWERRNRDAVAGALLDLEPGERKTVEDLFIEKYGELLNVSSVVEAVESRFTENDAQYIAARLAGEDHKAHALLIRDVFSSKGGLERVQLLSSLNDGMDSDELKAVLSEYRKLFSIDTDRDYLRQYFKPNLKARCYYGIQGRQVPENPILDWAENTFSGSYIEAAAGRIRAALKGLSGEWPGVVFYQHSLEQNQAIITAYNNMYSSDFWKDFKSVRGKESTIIMQSLLEDGDLTLAQQTRHFMIGWGADSDGMRACFEGLSAFRQEKLTEEYAEEFKIAAWWRPLSVTGAALKGCFDRIRGVEHSNGHWGKFIERIERPRNLDYDIRSEFDGHNRFDALTLRKGVITKPEAMMGALLDRFKHEMAGSAFVPPENRKTPLTERLRGWARSTVEKILEIEASFMNVNKTWRNLPFRMARKSGRLGLELVQLVLAKEKPDESCLKRDMDRAYDYYKTNFLEGSTPTDHQRRTFKQLFTLAQQSLDVRRETQNKKAEATANTISLVTASAAWFGLGVLQMPLLSLGSLVFAASLTGRALGKYYHKRAGYGVREFTRDAYLSAVDGATLSFGKLVKGYRAIRFLGFGRAALSTALKFGMKKGLYHIGHTSLTNALLESKESGHVRRHAAARRVKFLEDYEQIIHREVDLITKQNTWIAAASDLRPVFRRVAKGLGS